MSKSYFYVSCFIEINELERNSQGSVSFTAYTLYENYGFDSETKKYIGVGIIQWGKIGNSSSAREIDLTASK